MGISGDFCVGRFLREKFFLELVDVRIDDV